MKLTLSICLVLVSLASGEASPKCEVDCPDTEDVVWAIGDTCQVFRNKCYFDKANCNRQAEEQVALTVSTMDECRKLCPQICPFLYLPVTGTYNGQVRTFRNACEKSTYTCQTGETFLD